MWVAAVEMVKVVEFQVYSEDGTNKTYSKLDVGSKMRGVKDDSWKE